MNAKEIALKQELSLDEMKWLIEEYIYEKKGSRVSISLRSNAAGVDMFEIQLFFSAFNKALAYYLTKE